MALKLNEHGIVGHLRGKYKRGAIHIDRHIGTVEATSIAEARKKAQKAYPKYVIKYILRR